MRGAVLKAIAAIVLTPLLAFVLANFLPKEYTSSVGILVDTSPPMIDPAQNSKIDDWKNFKPRTVQTNIDMILGSKVIGDAIRRTAEDPDRILTNEKAEALIDLLPRRLRIDSQKDSDVVTIRVTLDDPQLAAKIANNIGMAYIASTQEIANKFGQLALEATNDRQSRVISELSAIDAQIKQIKLDLNVTDLPSQLTIAARTSADLELRLNDLSSKYNGTVAELRQAEQNLRSTPEYIDIAIRDQYNPDLAAVDQDLIKSKADLAQLREKYTDDRWEIQQLIGRIADLNAQKSNLKTKIEYATDRQKNGNYQEQLSVINRLREMAQSLEKQIAKIQTDKAATDRELVVYPEAEERLGLLLRKKTTLERTFQELEVKRTELEGSATETVGRKTNAFIVSDARASSVPSAPNPTLYTLAGLGLGIAIAAIIVLPKPTSVDPLANHNQAPTYHRPIGGDDETRSLGGPGGNA